MGDSRHGAFAVPLEDASPGAGCKQNASSPESSTVSWSASPRGLRVTPRSQARIRPPRV